MYDEYFCVIFYINFYLPLIYHTTENPMVSSVIYIIENKNKYIKMSKMSV